MMVYSLLQQFMLRGGCSAANLVNYVLKSGEIEPVFFTLVPSNRFDRVSIKILPFIKLYLEDTVSLWFSSQLYVHLCCKMLQ